MLLKVNRCFPLCISLVLLLLIVQDTSRCFSMVQTIRDHRKIFNNMNRCHYMTKRYLISIDAASIETLCAYFTIITSFVTLNILLIVILLKQSGDIHPNPGPESATPNNTSVTSSNSHALELSKYFSFVHYNVQSLYPKLDILSTELFNFDILAFSETWLCQNTKSEDLLITSFSLPERRDRDHDNHGGVILYVKNKLCYKRRLDLEPKSIECIWIELKLKCKTILFGIYYRPPNTNAANHLLIVNSINLACESNIDDVIITGYFNLNLNIPLQRKKIESLCLQNSLSQCIQEPTHFTEHSSSIIDLVLVRKSTHVLASDVSELFLNQDIRYHCPIYCVF